MGGGVPPTAEDGVFVGAVAAVVAAVAGFGTRQTLAVVALEVGRRTGVLADVGAERRLVAHVAAVVVSVAVEQLRNTHTHNKDDDKTR